MKHAILLTCSLLFLQTTFGQNVGVGENNPQHKLDVNGDINLTGDLRANGVAGTQNQMLVSSGNGHILWMDIGQFQNHETFSTVGSGTWTVPAGVTKIMVEAWGGGGGGSCQGGGGGGGYICAWFTVVPNSTVSFTVGDNGVGTNCVGTVSNHGENTAVTVGAVTVRGLGGQGSYSYGGGYFLGRGGAFSVSGSSFRNWRGIAGEDGTPNLSDYINPSSGVYWEQIAGGSGGNGGNSTNTKAYGGKILLNGTTVLKYVTGGVAKQPGGGGYGNSDHNTNYYGSSGADGMLVINY